jgi:HD-like signal output (HDOD) protein
MGDQEEIARSLETTHQFLSKPVRAKDLVATLSRIGKLDTLLLDEKLKALAGRLSSLPSFPSIYLQITKELNTEEPSIEAIADLTLQDPALTAKMLQVANSAAFGLPHKVSNPFDAVQFIGLNAVRSIALSAHVFRNFEHLELKTFSANQVWNESLLCARITRHIMRLKRVDENATEDACAAAILRNVGKLMLAKNLPQEFEKMMALVLKENISQAEAGRKVFGASHTSLAAYLFSLWGLAAPMVEAVALHQRPGESENRAFSPLTVVHVAHVFSAEMGSETTPGTNAKLDLDYLKAAGVDSEIEEWRGAVKEMLANE